MEHFSQRVGGWWLVPVRGLLVAALWLPLVALVAGAILIAGLAEDIPDAPDLSELLPPQQSRVTTRTGWHLAGSQARAVVPVSQLPPLALAAILAAEDADFFEHRALNRRAVVRAALTNLRAGGAAQGASTITQQVAKQFLSTDKTLRRKFGELLMARRIEASYSKSEILEAYLNSAYFGQRAYGIEQASWTYFGKPASLLEVGEAALLAGILPAPSRYNPVAAAQRARDERDQVLRRMAELGLLSAERAEAEAARPVELAEDSPIQSERMPYAAATALRVLASHFDDKIWAEGALTVVAAHDPVAQARARRSLRAGVEALDRRQGWRGPLARVNDATKVDALLSEQPVDVDFVLARVVDVERDSATVWTAGGEQTVSLAGARWASPAERERHFKRPAELDDLREVLDADDLVAVRREDERWRLVQPPGFEGALLVIDSRTGTVRASVGGHDPDRSIFHRAEQGCRQPGSVFKPIVYAEALTQRLSAATMLSDLPRSFDTGRGTVWQPRNADRDFTGYITLADALAWSRNIPTVHLMDYLGAKSVVARAKKLGVDSELDTTSSVALGASCVRPRELAAVYAAFQRRGRTVEVAPISHIVDADGDVLLDRGHFGDPEWSTAARLSRIALQDDPPGLGVSEEVAFITSRLLRRVVTAGTARDLPAEWQVAGKTGTTNEFDGWFVGFDGEATAVTWIGSDKNDRPLGDGEHGATVALPVFERFWADHVTEEPSMWQREPPERVAFETIDRESGLRSRPGEPGMELPFIRGTAPVEQAPTRGTRQAEQLDALSHEF
jgi:penicillin-binding protein 1A